MIYPVHIHLYVHILYIHIMMYDAQLDLINAGEAQFTEVPFMLLDPIDLVCDCVSKSKLTFWEMNLVNC